MEKASANGEGTEAYYFSACSGPSGWIERCRVGAVHDGRKERSCFFRKR
jgi:hypothetical protein